MIDQKKEFYKTSKQVRLAREFKGQFIVTVSTMMISAFALVAAFAWNDLVKEAITRYISPGQTLKSRAIYALLVTLIAVMISFQFGKIAAAYKVEQEDAEKKLKKTVK